MYGLASPATDQPPHQRVCSDTFLHVLTSSLAALRELAFKLTRSQSDADDLLQATCLRALESATRLRDQTNLTGWLTRVMRNLQIDFTRSQSRRMVPLTERQVAACAPEGIAMWRQIDDGELEQLVPRLSPQLRAVWELHHEDGLDQIAIAERLAIPRTTVATRLFRARLALRTALLKRHGDDATHAGPEVVKPRKPRPRLKVQLGLVAVVATARSNRTIRPRAPARPPAADGPLASAL